MAQSPLMTWYARTRSWPAGDWIFTKMIGFTIPYTGTIGARVLELEPGHSKVVMRDRRGVRNHLKSIHAIALMNLAEFSTGLAVTARMDNNTRAILTNLSIGFHKKARGPITAICNVAEADFTVAAEHTFEASLQNAEGEVVATAAATWKIGPKKGSATA